MASPKVNIISNDLDQAPKTRAAGYGKVVDSMREEMTEAMNGVNVPNIISNDLDQAPKTRAAGYEQNVLELLQDKIYDKMEMLFMKGSKVICDYVNKFVNKPENDIISDYILRLSPGDSMSFEIKRERKKYKGDWEKTIGPIVSSSYSSEKLNNFRHNAYYRDMEGKEIEKGVILTVIVVKKDANNPYLLHIHGEQLGIPGKGALLEKESYFLDSNVSDNKFKRIIG